VLEPQDDVLEHPVRLRQHFVIPVAKHRPAKPFERACPPAVGPGALHVLPAIQLDDETPFGAREIGEESPDRMLPPEFPAAEVPIAQVTPQQSLGIGLTAPQVPCA